MTPPSRSHIAAAELRYDVLAVACPTRQVIARIGDRWTLLVLYVLEKQTLRFQELRRAVEGISQRMLTHTLRALERDGIVQRTVYAEVPPRVEYQLTELGRELASHLDPIRSWAYENMAAIEEARERYDSAQT